MVAMYFAVPPMGHYFSLSQKMNVSYAFDLIELIVSESHTSPLLTNCNAVVD